MLFQQEYNLQVEYVEGKKQVIANTLSHATGISNNLQSQDSQYHVFATPYKDNNFL